MSMQPGVDGSPANFPFGIAGAGVIGSTALDANVTLTSTDNETQYFAISAARTVTLPTGANIPAGKPFYFANTGAFDLTVAASNGSALTLANGTNQDATIQVGYVRIRSLIANPTTPAHWRVEEVYEQFTQTGTTSGAVSTAFTARYTRFNRLVSGNFISATGTAVAVASITITGIPQRIRPIAAPRYNGGCVVESGGNQFGGIASVSVAGDINFNRVDVNNFAGVSAIGFNTFSTDFSWSII